MLKILTNQQTKELDTYTIVHEPISSIDLMERACRAFTGWFTSRFDVSKKIGIVCGTGNNGGDGLGIARLLHELGYAVKVWIVRGAVSETNDFKINLERLSGKVEVYEIKTSSDKGLFINIDVLIDALFGSGLSRALEGIYAQVVNCINQASAVRVAVDIPSGLMADQYQESVIVRAHFTVTFQLPRLSFFLPLSDQYTGEWFIINIGLSKIYIGEAPTNYFFIQQADAKQLLKPRQKFSHKGAYGKGLLVTGSFGKMGAAILAAKAAMRSGLGLLTTHIPLCGYQIMQTSVPESMISADDNEKAISEIPSLNDYDAVGIGPGMGTTVETVKAFASVLEQADKPLVIDADGLNIMASQRELLNLIPKNSLLTPHPKEFERLAGTWSNDFNRLEMLRQFSIHTNAIIILKGAYTSIASPDGRIFFNSTGNPGMATGGSGDVLTGLLTGLLAQHYTPLEAAVLGVYLHGLAGDYAAKKKSMNAMIASDLIECLPEAFIDLNA